MKKGRKTGSSKCQKKQAKSNTDVIDSTNNKNEITAYFVRSADKYAPPDNARIPDVPVPSPDDAALPNSSLCSTENCNHKEDSNKSKADYKESEKKHSGDQQSIKNSEKALTNGNSPTLLNSKNLCTKKKAKKKDPEKKEKLLTDYFPVRRSNRNCKLVKIEKQKQFEEGILSGSEEGFEVKEFYGKGRGIIANRMFKRGDFVLEYYGELIDVDEAKKREKLYSAAEKDVGCYMYYFHCNSKQYCIDATKESGRLGRLVNHSKKKGNLKTQPFFIEETPHLILIASRDILPGEELLYDYGDRSKRSLESHPWLAS